MAGAVVAMDDAWQAEHLPHAHGHFGQYATAHELLVQGGNARFEALLVPRPPPASAQPRDRRLHVPEEVVTAVAAQGADDGTGLFGAVHARRSPFKTVVLRKRASRAPGSATSAEHGVGDVARVAAVDTEDRERAFITLQF